MMFELNLTENMNQYLINIQSTMISITVSFYLTDSDTSSFLINNTLIFSALSSELKSVLFNVFYTDYTETFNADNKSYEFSLMIISLITALFTMTSHISTVTSDSIISSSTANS